VEDEYYGPSGKVFKHQAPKVQEQLKPPIFFGDRMYAPIPVNRIEPANQSDLMKKAVRIEKTISGIPVRTRLTTKKV